MSVTVLNADARHLPLADNSVDLTITSPPYWALRTYLDAGEALDGQIGNEPTMREYLDHLLEATAEMMRVTKPSGSIVVNLGDKYGGRSGGPQGKQGQRADRAQAKFGSTPRSNVGTPKSLLGLPWRFAIAAMDELGLLLRSEIIWQKPNAMPDSVTDRVRRSHEQIFVFTQQPSYYSCFDAIREPHSAKPPRQPDLASLRGSTDRLGRIPGSVWSLATVPFCPPAELGIRHFAAFPPALPARLISALSPAKVCLTCGEGLRAVTEFTGNRGRTPKGGGGYLEIRAPGEKDTNLPRAALRERRIVGWSCSCVTPGPTVPGVVLDPFGGTGTTGLVADVLGRRGIVVDASADYCELARWRISDASERSRAVRHTQQVLSAAA